MKIGLSRPEIIRLVNDYIEVHGGYLGDFSYNSHADFYPYYCDLDINPLEYGGTTRERFIHILTEAQPGDQVKIIKGVFRKYPITFFEKEKQENKKQIYHEFIKIIERIERNINPIRESIGKKFVEFDEEYIHKIWEEALTRLNENPEAAITSARTLLEGVCKYILDENYIEYDPKIDLPKLYKRTASQLNLGPEQHTEKIFKQILNGCQSVIEGLGSLRNKLGDAHGQGKRRVRPAYRHAELAVNLAGSMSLFLIKTFEHRKNVKTQ